MKIIYYFMVMTSKLPQASAEPPSSDISTPASSILRAEAICENLHFYQKAKTLYVITYYFTQNFLFRGDRTIDQMIQAARLGKQNIIEGSAAGVISAESELRLLNVARASLKELREDYEDYLQVRHLPIWDASHPEYQRMLNYCREHDMVEDYEPYLSQSTAEKIANLALTLCHLADKMMLSYQRRLERKFAEEGGVRERMRLQRGWDIGMAKRNKLPVWKNRLLSFSSEYPNWSRKTRD